MCSLSNPCMPALWSFSCMRVMRGALPSSAFPPLDFASDPVLSSGFLLLLSAVTTEIVTVETIIVYGAPSCKSLERLQRDVYKLYYIYVHFITHACTYAWACTHTLQIYAHTCITLDNVPVCVHPVFFFTVAVIFISESAVQTVHRCSTSS